MSVISQTTRPGSTPDILIPNLTCDSTVLVGDWVRVDDSELIVQAMADSFLNSTVLGLVEEKGNSTLCTVRVAGVSKILFTGLNTSIPYFLDPANPGKMITVVPSSSGNVILSLGRPLTDTRFLVQPALRLQRA